METNREHMRLEMESLSRNEEFARVVTAVFMSRLDPTLEEVDDVKTAVSEAVTNAVIHGYRGDRGTIYLDLTADMEERTLTVAVKDCGVGIADVKQAMEPMFTTDPEGERSGMGFFLHGGLYGPGRGGVRTKSWHIGDNEEIHRQVTAMDETMKLINMAHEGG